MDSVFTNLMLGFSVAMQPSVLAYAFAEPLGNRLKQIIDQDGQIYHVAKQIIVGTLNGHPMPVIIEAARVSISHENQPSFSEVFDGLRGK